MKKFEEEFDKNVTSVALRQDGESVITVCDYNEAKAFGHGWVSPEDHQAEVGKIELQNLKYREEIARMQKSLRKKNKAIKELNGAVKKVKLEREAEVRENQRLRGVIGDMSAEIGELKSQLEKQQPEVPEVPQLVADWLDKKPLYAINGSIPVEIIEWSQKQTGYADLGMNISHLLKLKVNGYTVAKEKRFYLKNKSVLIFDPDSDDSDVEELYLGAGDNFVPYKHLAKIFTQSQIDSMETGSYEQFEVEE